MHRSGFTLMEIVIVVAVVAMLIVAISPFIGISFQAWDIGSRRTEVLQNARVGMDKMITDIRQAIRFNYVTRSDDENGEIEFEIFKVMEDEKGKEKEKNILHTRRYFFEDSWLNMWDRNEETGEEESGILAGPIQILRFTCYEEAPTQIANPPLPDPLQVTKIRSVEIELQVSDEEGQISPITVTSRAFVRRERLKLVINEIMYHPSFAQRQGAKEAKLEWVELYNFETYDIDLEDWQLGDTSETSEIQAWQNGTTVIKAGGYAIVAAKKKETEVYKYWDALIPGEATRLTVKNKKIGDGLDNNDTVILLSPDEVMEIDRVTYYDHWGGGGDGKTLERIDPEGASSQETNWDEGPVDGTPGAKNEATP